MKTKQLIFKMLTENTGRALCDSGGAYGRNWERNQNKTLDDFENNPSCTFSVDMWETDGKKRFDANVNIDLFHHLNRVLELDGLCDDFNALPVNDWDSDFYGVSNEGFEWLNMMGFTSQGDGFNSYNWNASFSQVIQGQFLDHENGDLYVLLQIHGGCDVRGGYTDAKLFRMAYPETYTLFNEDCGFCVQTESGDDISIYWNGADFSDVDGSFNVDEDLEQIYQITQGKPVKGDLFEVCY